MDIDKLKALALAATPGPWHCGSLDRNGVTPTVYAAAEELRYVAQCKDFLNLTPTPNEANARFIAACREAVPELIAEVERLRARFEYIEEHATTQGGGNGFTITCFVPADHEDIGCGIDSAIESHSKAEKERT